MRQVRFGMTVKRRRVLSIAVRSGRLACVLFSGGEVMDWRCSNLGAQFPDVARLTLRNWLGKYAPEIVVLELHKTAKLKADRQIMILKSLAIDLKRQKYEHRLVTRLQFHKNKFEEAEHIALRYPALAHKVPRKPRLWEPEPYNVVFFEAVALALPIIDTFVYETD